MSTAPSITGTRAGILSPTEVIDRARAARRTALAAAAEQLEMALAWALLHPCGAQETPAHWGEVDLHGEATMPLAGPGAPLVAEFAPAEMGAALGVTSDAARQLIADALELTYRLPRLAGHVRAGRVPAWRARRIAQLTRDLTLEAAAYADRLISATPGQVSRIDPARLVNEARLYFDPDRAIADEEEALTKRGVWLRHGPAPATTEVTMTLDTPDAQLLDQTLNRVAADLRDLGDTNTRDIRRARAAGILANPQHALDLMSGHCTEQTSTSPRSKGDVHLYLHLTPEDLSTDTSDTGAAVIEHLGAATTTLLQDWLTRFAEAGAEIIVRPVLDLNTSTGKHSAAIAVDQHDPPQWMREIVLLRDAHCVFPACRRDSRSCDLDHITEYLPTDDGGPPGQTRPDNLAPLCRTHHRIKTHTTWTYKRLDTGGYTWTSPTGHQYDVVSITRRPRAR